MPTLHLLFIGLTAIASVLYLLKRFSSDLIFFILSMTALILGIFPASQLIQVILSPFIGFLVLLGIWGGIMDHTGAFSDFLTRIRKKRSYLELPLVVIAGVFFYPIRFVRVCLSKSKQPALIAFAFLIGNGIIAVASTTLLLVASFAKEIQWELFTPFYIGGSFSLLGLIVLLLMSRKFPKTLPIDFQGYLPFGTGLIFQKPPLAVKEVWRDGVLLKKNDRLQEGDILNLLKESVYSSRDLRMIKDKIYPRGRKIVEFGFLLIEAGSILSLNLLWCFSFAIGLSWLFRVVTFKHVFRYIPWDLVILFASALILFHVFGKITFPISPDISLFLTQSKPLFYLGLFFLVQIFGFFFPPLIAAALISPIVLNLIAATSPLSETGVLLVIGFSSSWIFLQQRGHILVLIAKNMGAFKSAFSKVLALGLTILAALLTTAMSMWLY